MLTPTMRLACQRLSPEWLGGVHCRLTEES
jgi:hypothetical protein